MGGEWMKAIVLESAVFERNEVVSTAGAAA
jgi:hypothetical protein